MWVKSEEFAEFLFRFEEVFGVVGEQCGAGHEESRSWKNLKKAFHIVDEER